METKNDAAREQARAQMDSILEMIAALEVDYDRLEELEDRGDLDQDELEELGELRASAGDCKDADEARQRIEEYALSVEVRSGWSSPGGEMQPEEFRILLCTGGPAVQVVGELDKYNEPDKARLQYQDWFTPWEELILSSEEYDALLTYCQCFYFGD